MGGVGAIVAARVAASFGTPLLVSLVIGMVAVIPVSVLVGLPSLRARGVSLAIATLGFAVAINATVLNNSSLNGGVNGLTLEPASVFGISVDATTYPRRFFIVCLVVFALLAVAVANPAARADGPAPARGAHERARGSCARHQRGGRELYAFVVAGVIAGAGGTLTVLSQSLPQFSGFDPLAGLTNLINAVLGGLGYLGGTILGGLFSTDGLPLTIVNPIVSDWSWWNAFFPLALGVIVVLQLIGNPDGIADVIVHGPDNKGARKRAAAKAAAAPGQVSWA